MRVAHRPHHGEEGLLNRHLLLFINKRYELVTRYRIDNRALRVIVRDAGLKAMLLQYRLEFLRKCWVNVLPLMREVPFKDSHRLVSDVRRWIEIAFLHLCIFGSLRRDASMVNLPSAPAIIISLFILCPA